MNKEIFVLALNHEIAFIANFWAHGFSINFYIVYEHRNSPF